MSEEAAQGPERQRVDRWLHFARVVKTRSLAAKLAVSGRVRLNREKVSQASQPVRPGDVLTITMDRRILVYKVLLPGSRRGSATEARLLYEDLSPPAEPVAPVAGRDPGSGRPSGKDRRALRRLFPD